MTRPCVYVGTPSVTPSTTLPKTVRAVMGILHAKTITTYIKTPGGETLSLTRHFLNIDSTRVVYTLQDVPASGPDNSVVTSPQANISTVAHGMVIQIVVTGTAQPQVVAEKAMRDALAAR